MAGFLSKFKISCCHFGTRSACIIINLSSIPIPQIGSGLKHKSDAGLLLPEQKGNKGLTGVYSRLALTIKVR